MNFIRRFFVLKKVHVDNGLFLFSKNTEVTMGKGAKIIVRNGIFRVGFSMSDSNPFPHFLSTKIHLAENSILEINGDVNIGPGSAIILNKDSTMKFGGSNATAHNNLFYCFKKIEFGYNSCSSWNCQFMDSDGHTLFSSKNGGRLIKPIYRPLIIGDHVGFQMNVSIPRGVVIGNNSLISSHIVVKNDVPEDSLVILQQDLKIKKGIMTPYGKETE
jgi:acetyltransferase-like isoleucine patch superfamily enzyme